MANLKLLQIDHLGEVTNIVGIGTTTAGLMGTVVGVSTTSDVNVGYTYDSGTFTAPTQPTVTTEQHWDLPTTISLEQEEYDRYMTVT